MGDDGVGAVALLTQLQAAPLDAGGPVQVGLQQRIHQPRRQGRRLPGVVEPLAAGGGTQAEDAVAAAFKGGGQITKLAGMVLMDQQQFHPLTLLQSRCLN